MRMDEMTQADTRYRAHKVHREDRPDGTILLRSGHELSEVAAKTGDWLHRWAAETPEAVFLAERSGPGWREVPYGEALEQVQAMAAALLERGLGPETPILIASGNGVDHGLLSMAAHYVGIPTVPVAEQYSLIPGAQKQLKYILGLIDPRMVFADDGEKYGSALALEEMAGREIVVARNPGAGHHTVADLLKGGGADVAAAAAQVGPDSVVKILMTSGSTSSPKGVLTTHGMMCANQAQMADALPFLRQHKPRIVDWLPWNHVFGGSHNFNAMLANGGALYIDGGKPVKGMVETTIENNRMVSGTMAFNVPVGFAMLRDALHADKALRESYFGELDMLFYAGASLPQDVWEDMEAMAREVRGDVPLMNSSWGLTETAPACLIQHQKTDRSGIVGVPMTGVTIKLLPDESDDTGNRFEVRVKGPNVMRGYFEDPEKTAAAFDEEGYFVTGDAMAFVDPAEMNLGLKFDGRISEDFKLQSGVWVRAAKLRLDVLAALAPLVADVIVTGEGKRQAGLLIFPAADQIAAGRAEEGVLRSPALEAELTARLARLAETAPGASNRLSRALVLAEPASMAEGEITAKGNLNFRKVLTLRAGLLDRLYDEGDGAVIRV